MWQLLTKLRKTRSTSEQLEEIENELKCLADFQFDTQKKQKRIAAALVVYSAIIYILTALLFYFYCLPSQLHQQLLYFIPLLVFPALVYSLRRFINWYFKKRLARHDDDMADLRRRKRKILDNVMETETYKVAKEILEKHDPEHAQKKLNGTPGVPSHLAVPSSSHTELRRRSLQSERNSPPVALVSPATLAGDLASTTRRVLPIVNEGVVAPGPPMPRPVPPRERGVFDRLVDYMMGEGPGSKFALICNRCQSHNGMAAPEEYQYMAFRCCYCFHWNPAKKQRPLAPRLPIPAVSTEELQDGGRPEVAGSSESDREDSDGPRAVESRGAGDATGDSTCDNRKSVDTGDHNDASAGKVGSDGPIAETEE